VSGGWGLSLAVRTELERLASAIANELWFDLEEKRITAIGIDEIRGMISKIIPRPLPGAAAELLEEQTLRCIVEKVG
jgi:hypothetical protein